MNTIFALGTYPLPWVIERFGRRAILMWSAVALTVFMAIFVAMIGLPSPSTATQYTAVASIACWNGLFGFGWIGVAWLYGPEVRTILILSKFWCCGGRAMVEGRRGWDGDEKIDLSPDAASLVSKLHVLREPEDPHTLFLGRSLHTGFHNPLCFVTVWLTLFFDIHRLLHSNFAILEVPQEPLANGCSVSLPYSPAVSPCKKSGGKSGFGCCCLVPPPSLSSTSCAPRLLARHSKKLT